MIKRLLLFSLLIVTVTTVLAPVETQAQIKLNSTTIRYSDKDYIRNDAAVPSATGAIYVPDDYQTAPNDCFGYIRLDTPDSTTGIFQSRLYSSQGTGACRNSTASNLSFNSAVDSDDPYFEPGIDAWWYSETQILYNNSIWV